MNHCMVPIKLPIFIVVTLYGVPDNSEEGLKKNAKRVDVRTFYYMNDTQDTNIVFCPTSSIMTSLYY